jgi:hypothetical protein
MSAWWRSKDATIREMFFILIRTSNLEAENDSYPVKLGEGVVMEGFILFALSALILALSRGGRRDTL